MAGTAIAVAATAIPSAIFLILDSPLNLPVRLLIPARFAGNKTRTSNFHTSARPTRTVQNQQGFRPAFVPAPDPPDGRKASGEVHFARFCCANATPQGVVAAHCKGRSGGQKKWPERDAPALRLRSQEERGEAGPGGRYPDPAKLWISCRRAPRARRCRDLRLRPARKPAGR